MALAGAWSVASRKAVEQGLGGLQVRRPMPFGEGGVDLAEPARRLGLTVLSGEQLGQARGRAQLEEQGGLVVKRSEENGGSTSELIFLVEEAPEGGFTSKALGTSIFTEADGPADLYDKIRDAVRCHFDEAHLPKIIRLHFVREEVITA